jgi:hypothetical protein
MKMYPVASYGKKEVTYLVYSSIFDGNSHFLTVDFQGRYTSIKDYNSFLVAVKLLDSFYLS